jgi:MGT family glycosyltransferase
MEARRPVRFLFAMFQGGGNIPLIMPIVRELASRGHDVRVMAGPGIRGRPRPVSEDFLGRIQASGAKLVPFESQGDPYASGPAIRGVAFGWIPRRFQQLVNSAARTTLWSQTWASNVVNELGRAPANVLVCDYWLFGAIAAGESLRVPTGVVVHNAFPPRTWRAPPPRNLSEALRQVPDRWMAARIWARDGLPAHNHTRRELGLQRLASSPFEECNRAARVLVLGYESFDFRAKKLPSNLRYVGTPIDDADVGPDTWTSPWPADDPRPLVVVSMSTLPQGQGPALHRIVEAVRGMDIRALVTLGPSLQKDEFEGSANVVLEQFVQHSAVLPHASVMVSQCGLGTLSKALRLGVPLLCVPLVADQPDNAARIVARGAGLLLRPDASTADVRSALTRLLVEPSFRESARKLGETMIGDRAERRAADELEALAHHTDERQTPIGESSYIGNRHASV